MSYKFIILKKESDIATIIFNRPKQLNALDIPTLLEVESAVEDVQRDKEIRVLIITGSGDKSFVAGGDIADLNSRNAIGHRDEFATIIHRVFNKIADLEKPVIAAVNGYALGGGTELLCSCDLRIASENAKFGLPEINLGIFPGAGGTQRLARQIPLCKAKELMFTGDMISAQEAKALGLVNKVVPGEILMQTTSELAMKLASKAPIALKLVKTVVNRGVETDLTTALALEREMIGLVFATNDAHEGLGAFLEKRKAVFKGE